MRLSRHIQNFHIFKKINDFFFNFEIFRFVFNFLRTSTNKNQKIEIFKKRF